MIHFFGRQGSNQTWENDDNTVSLMEAASSEKLEVEPIAGFFSRNR
jgi:hypothetical protein